MKKVLLLVFALIALSSCKNEKKAEDKNNSIDNIEKTETENEGLTLIKGVFIYLDDAAVLQTKNEVYSVIIDDKMHELNAQVQKYKTETTDMVPVELRGKITPKPENEEGWAFRVEIKEIITVSKPNPEDGEMITIGKE